MQFDTLFLLLPNTASFGEHNNWIIIFLKPTDETQINDILGAALILSMRFVCDFYDIFKLELINNGK